MEAKEALALAERSRARHMIQFVIPMIEGAAKEGRCEVVVGTLGVDVEKALRLLGYGVERAGASNNTRISWGEV